MSSSLDALYKNAAIHLWVEDDVTRAYLQTAWDSDPDIGIHVGGGWTNVEAIVHSSHESHYRNVFGFRDRDFGATNRPRWKTDESIRIFCGEALEVENHLIDDDAIAGCELNTTTSDADQIGALLMHEAEKQSWWIACRTAIDSLARQVTDRFIAHPSLPTIGDQRSAEQAILSSGWVKSIVPSIPAAVQAAAISNVIATAKQAFVADLNSKAWMNSCSGKEVINAVIPRVWTKKRTPGPAQKSNFAKAVAKQQRSLGRVPTEIVELQSVLRSRLAL